jgi:hypothetical protein
LQAEVRPLQREHGEELDALQRLYAIQAARRVRRASAPLKGCKQGAIMLFVDVCTEGWRGWLDLLLTLVLLAFCAQVDTTTTIRDPALKPQPLPLPPAEPAPPPPPAAALAAAAAEGTFRFGGGAQSLQPIAAAPPASAASTAAAAATARAAALAAAAAAASPGPAVAAPRTHDRPGDFAAVRQDDDAYLAFLDTFEATATAALDHAANLAATNLEATTRSATLAAAAAAGAAAAGGPAQFRR